tara:strand:+ start:408 stop:596 length:189 start_codon:yes stop_codon:yes gene_type:complete
MEGEYQVTNEEIQEAWYRFWGKNKLAINDKGKIYRTSTPRKMPDSSSIDYSNYEKRKTAIYT